MAANTVKGWNPLLKFLHWFLAILVIVAFVTSDNLIYLHVYSGYAILGVLFFRIFWGILGPEHARLMNFITGPTRTLQYLKELADGSQKGYTVHNPISGHIIMLMLAMLLVIVFSGLKLYAAYGQGPLAASAGMQIISSAAADEDDHHDDHNDEDEMKTKTHGAAHFWKEMHESSSSLLLILIGLHILTCCILPKLARPKQEKKSG